MNLRDLKYLVAVADNKHFGKAAEACFVAQPTLSMQFKKLEEFLGVKLAERTNKQVLMTPVGNQIVEIARTIISQADQIRQIAKQAHDPFGGEFKLGIIPTVAAYLLPKVLPKIRQAFPNLDVQVVEGQTHDITAQLHYGELDALILALPIEDDNFTEAELYREPFYMAVSTQHPYANRSQVTQDDLSGEQVLLLEDGHCLREQALTVCNMAGALERTNFKASNLETLRQMVAANAGITLMPELAIKGYESNDIAYVSFQKPVPYRRIGLVWRSSSHRMSLMEQMVEDLQNLPSIV